PVPPAHRGPSWLDLDSMERAYLYRGSTAGPKLGVRATLFSLAQRGKLRLVLRPKAGPLGGEDVAVEILDETGLVPTEQSIVSSLQQRGTLQRFAQGYKVVDTAT